VLGTVGGGLRAGNHLRSAGADELAGRRCSPGEPSVAWRRLRIVFVRPRLYRALVSPLFLCVNLGVGVAVMVGGGGGDRRSAMGHLGRVLANTGGSTGERKCTGWPAHVPGRLEEEEGWRIVDLIFNGLD
jgi:hypothetical protein